VKKITTPRARGAWLGGALVLVALMALVGGAARVSAATTTITITSTQKPAATTAATLSSTGQTTYVFYSLTFVSQSSWTHVTLSDVRPTVTLNGTPVTLDDAAVVFVDGCPSTPTLSGGGFSCAIDKLAPGVAQTFNIVVQTPTSGDTLAVNPTLAGDETFNDQPNGKQDTFPTPLQWSLTSDTTNALTSYTNPAVTTGTASFATDKHLCVGSACTPAAANKQSTQADVPNGLAPLGTLVSLQERPFGLTECPTFATSAGQKCFGQVSDISVGSSGAGGVFDCAPPNNYPTSCGNSLVFTLRVAAGSLTTKVDPKKAFLIHDPTGTGTAYEKVPFCSTGLKDSTGDCTLSIVIDPVTKDVISTGEGPGNGSWGGA
jgi:hypothetical protein